MLRDVVRLVVGGDGDYDVAGLDPIPGGRLISENDRDTGHPLTPAMSIYLKSCPIPFLTDPCLLA